MSEKTILSKGNSTKEELKEPGLYRVLLHNDDYTSMDFVVDILVSVFRKSGVDASKIMLAVHKEGKGIAGVYTYDIGMSKIQEVTRRAKEDSFPLLCSMEKV